MLTRFQPANVRPTLPGVNDAFSPATNGVLLAGAALQNAMTQSLCRSLFMAVSEAALGSLLRTEKENIMAIIGTFRREDNIYSGFIRTLSFTASVTIEPVSTKRGDKSPDYRVFCQSSGPGEIGAAWERIQEGSSHLSIRIDDPNFATPIDCRLIKTGAEHGYSLIWERDRKRS